MDNSPVSATAPQPPQINGLPTPATGTRPLAAAKSLTADSLPSPLTPDPNGTLENPGEPEAPCPPTQASAGPAVTSAGDVKASTPSTKPAASDGVPIAIPAAASGSASLSSPAMAHGPPVSKTSLSDPAQSSAVPVHSSTSPAVTATTASATDTATSMGSTPASKSPPPVATAGAAKAPTPSAAATTSGAANTSKPPAPPTTSGAANASKPPAPAATSGAANASKPPAPSTTSSAANTSKPPAPATLNSGRSALTPKPSAPATTNATNASKPPAPVTTAAPSGLIAPTSKPLAPVTKGVMPAPTPASPASVAPASKSAAPRKTPSRAEAASSYDAIAPSPSSSSSSPAHAPWMMSFKYQWLLIVLHWVFVLGPVFFLRVVLLSLAAYVVYAILTVKRTLATLPRKFREDKGVKKAHYDVAIVGAGPAGSTLAYYLAKSGRKVLLLEKKTFPRDKYCGDAVCKTGVEILMDMGIYDGLIREDKARVADCGGLVSPGGLSYIGQSSEIMGNIPAAIACKRLHLDNATAMAAKGAGADLKENSSVTNATLCEASGFWSVTVEGSRQPYQARVLACCDGAPSALATKLGIITTPPQGSCSRAYVEPGTHRFKADGVVVYNKGMLPGYSALFRHPKNELNYCVYIIPGNPQIGNDDLPYWHEHLMKNDPFISRALGDKAKIERMKVASLRFGGVPRSYGDQVLLVGDAAGMIDPMTGEGIHTAMDGGRVAAAFLEEALARGNVGAEAMEIYHRQWMEKFGHDFKWSSWLGYLQYKFPIVLDAATAAIQRKGDKFMVKWADIMTSRVPKSHLLRPEYSLVVCYELVVLLFRRAVDSFRRKQGYSEDEELKKEE